jgi:hypothetical protein
MLDIIHTDNLIKTLAEEAIEVAYAAANRWTGLPSTHMFRFFFPTGKRLVPIDGEL